MKNIRLIGILAAVAALLMIPFVAMKIGVEGVAWKVGDFIVAGILLLGAGSRANFSCGCSRRRSGVWRLVRLC